MEGFSSFCADEQFLVLGNYGHHSVHAIMVAKIPATLDNFAAKKI